MKTLRMGTRGSQLALAQATQISQRIEELKTVRIETRIISTEGDRILDKPLGEIGGKELFIKEIEKELLEGNIDLAVHSMKDIPSEIPNKLAIGAVPERDDPADILILKSRGGWKDLPEKSIIGTSSLRRKVQLLRLRPDVSVVDIRGNLDTRLRKLNEGTIDGIIVALCGLKRLGLSNVTGHSFSPEAFLPAPGQGALCVEIRSDDRKINKIVSALDHEETRLCIEAERSFMEAFGGGCHIPLGVLGWYEDGQFFLDGFIASPDGEKFLRDRIISKQGGHEAGYLLSNILKDKGADEILGVISK